MCILLVGRDSSLLQYNQMFFAPSSQARPSTVERGLLVALLVSGDLRCLGQGAQIRGARSLARLNFFSVTPHICVSSLRNLLLISRLAQNFADLWFRLFNWEFATSKSCKPAGESLTGSSQRIIPFFFYCETPDCQNTEGASRNVLKRIWYTLNTT
jgi:hypothetical protein